jgi:adenosylcobyric acid synthase
MGWRERSATLAVAAQASLQRLAATCDLVVIEGAGSPAEINLAPQDYVNLGTARQARELGAFDSLLVADIDRGGAFAHLYGTWALLPEHERALIAGFVLNKFRGDPALLPPAPEQLQELTGVPTVGVLPWLRHGLPDEDGAFVTATNGSGRTVAVVRYPTASNLDELKPLEQVADVRWATSPADLDGAALVVLPGSKHVAADLAWLKDTGLAAAVAAIDTPVLGICGGLQMLGRSIVDDAGVDGTAEGLGLLPLTTRFAAEKTTRATRTRFAELEAPWRALSGVEVDGYEIRHGETAAVGDVEEALPDGLGFVSGRVLGVTVHGMFEQPRVVHALAGDTPASSLDAVFESLADAVEEHLDLDRVLA